LFWSGSLNALAPFAVACAMKGSKDADQPGHDSAAYVASVDERATAGKALRDKIPRHEHGRWKNSKGRANPVDLLRKSDTGRMKELLAIRYVTRLPKPAAMSFEWFWRSKIH
jgi:hypothetical protein